jgi:glycerophosphoryl diester phosphodiesterase
VTQGSRRVAIHGHRGARALFPENTFDGFRRTLALGVDAIEMDVALTADGIAVVTHDLTLNPAITRGPDGSYLPAVGPAIRTLRASDLAAYDVGRIDPASAYARAFPDQTAQDGARIPRFAEVAALPAAVLLNVELKTAPDRPGLSADPAALADAVVADATDAGARHRLTVQSFDWRGLRHLCRTAPDIPLGWLTSHRHPPAPWWDGAPAGPAPDRIADLGGGTWAPAHEELDAPSVAHAHRLGLRVVPWTVNTAEDMRRLLACGVDGLITDRPDLALTVLAALV